MHYGRYHSFLKITAVVFVTTLLFDGGFLHPITKQLSDNTINYLASVGSSVTAQVAPTELNTLTAELTARERELAEREAALAAREISARDFGTSEEADYSTYILSIILFILTTLIILNYILDWLRIRNTRYEKKMA